MPEMTFNVDHGYLEGLLRGFKSGILRQNDYLNLVQCETLEGRVFFKADVSQGLVTASIELLLFEITPSQAINLMQLIFIYPKLCMDLINSDDVFLIYAACYKFCRNLVYIIHDILFVYHIQILFSIFTSVFFNFYLNKISLNP